MSGTWRPLEADPGGLQWPGRGRSLFVMLSCMSKYRFVRVMISILTSKLISGTWRPFGMIMEAGSGQVKEGKAHSGMSSGFQFIYHIFFL